MAIIERSLGARPAWALVAMVGLVAGGSADGAAAGDALPPTTRVSIDVDLGDPDGPSHNPAVNGDGRFVAFESTASDLVPDDGNGLRDIFIFDAVTGLTSRASVDPNGGDANGSSFDPAMTPNGRFVAFDSVASNLVSEDVNGYSDVFVRDTTTGLTRRVSVDRFGGESAGDSFNPSISGSGRFVAFWSAAPDLVPNDFNGVWDVFVRDMVSGRVMRASVGMGGGDPDLDSVYPTISADGRYIAFTSAATNLVSDDLNENFDVFLRDMLTRSTVRLSVDALGGDANGSSHNPAISKDGKFVTFYSTSSDLVPNDGNFLIDVFIRDLATGVTARVSLDAEGGDADGSSFDPSISADGRYVAFRSPATDLVVDDTNGHQDVFVRDIVAGTTVRASVDSSGGDADSISYSSTSAISSNGQYVAFWSFASDLVAGDGNGLADAFIRNVW